MVLLRLLACSALDALEEPVARDCDTRTLWYRDADGDGAGEDTAVRIDCEQPSGYVGDSG